MYDVSALVLLVVCCTTTLQAAKMVPDIGVEKFSNDREFVSLVLAKLQEFDAMKERLVDQEQKIKRLVNTVRYQGNRLLQQEKRIRDLEKKEKLDPEKDSNSSEETQHRKNNIVFARDVNQLESRRILAANQPANVAFTAYLGKQLQNLAENQTVQLPHVLLNDGNAYDGSSGVFTCPVAGVYLFSFFISEYGVHDTRVRLVVDGVNQVDAIIEGEQPTSNDQGGNTAIIRLALGQSAWLEVYDYGEATTSSTLSGSPSRRRNTYSGVLLYADDQ